MFYRNSNNIGEKIWGLIYILIPHLNNYYSDFFVDNSINMNYGRTFKPFVSTYLQVPYPRSISLFSELNKEMESIDTTIAELISLKSSGKHIIVYMPTYRSEINKRKKLENQLTKLFKLFSIDDRFVFVYKSHFIVSDIVETRNENILEYANPDPYPLLEISSALISDYSSVIFDYMPTKKPLSIFAYDIDLYKDNPGYYYDIEKLFSSFIAREPSKVYNMLYQKLINKDDNRDEQVNIFNNLFLPSYKNREPYDIEQIRQLCGINK